MGASCASIRKIHAASMTSSRRFIRWSSPSRQFLADSIRPWLPVMEQAYQKNGRQCSDEVVQLVSRYGDSATKALWESRPRQRQQLPFLAARL